MDFLLFLQENQNELLTTFFEAITKLADKTLIIAVVCYLYWCCNKKTAQKIAVGYFFSGLAIQMMKVIFRIPRPWILDSRIQPTEEMKETATGYSFPSGHTQTATSFCYSLLDVVKKNWIKVILIVFPFLMMFSRMYVLVHSPLDVSVSFIVTAIIVLLSMRYLNKNHDEHLKNLSIVMLVGSIIGMIYAYYIVYFDGVSYELAADTVKMMGAILGFALGCLLEMKYLNFKPRSVLKRNIVIVVIGLIGTIALQSGLKLILPSHMFVDFLRYFLAIFWIIYIYPCLFTKYIK